MLRFKLLPLRNKDFHNQRRNGEAKPFDDQPPPANENPPEETVMLVFKLGFRYRLNIYIRGTALGANHINPFLSSASKYHKMQNLSRKTEKAGDFPAFSLFFHFLQRSFC